MHHALLSRNLACGQTKFRHHFGDCALHEQIVIPFPHSKVLSKEQRSRLKEWPLYSEYGACSLKSRHSLDGRLFLVQRPHDRRDI